MSEYEPFDLVGQAAQKEEQQLRAKILAENEVKNLQWVMSDKRGRAFIWWLLGLTGVFRISFTGNSETFFREGMRNIGVMLLDQLKTHCDELYIAMERERKNGRRNTSNADDGNDKH